MSTIITEKVKMDRSARRRYKSPDGKAIPGVTTILGVLAKPALIDWAWKLGMKQIDYKKIRDSAADIGTIAHFMCECHMKKSCPDLSEFTDEQVAQATICFNKFRQFWDTAGLKVLHNEIALTIEDQFGGTLDVVCEDEKGNIVIVDLKTSNGIYSDYWAQVAAYGVLWNNQSDRKVNRSLIVRIGKEDVSDLEVVSKSDIKEYWELFMGAYTVYLAQAMIRKLEK